MKKIYILPNLFTTASLFCGMLAITNIIVGDFETACLLILISAILDMLDGKIARLTKTQTSFGLNYDSLSDLVAFGVAPGVLIFAWLRSLSPDGGIRLAAGVATLYPICGALRLARFNVQVVREEKKYFIGLPIPAAAGAVVSTFLAFWKQDMFGEWEPHVFLRFLPFFFVGVSCLMVSNIPYMSLKHIDLEKRKPFDYLVMIIILACIGIALWHMRTLMLLFGFWAYALSGVLGRVMRFHRLREEEKQAPLPTPRGDRQ